MLILSRRSAVLALFVILAFATTLLAMKPDAGKPTGQGTDSLRGVQPTGQDVQSTEESAKPTFESLDKAAQVDPTFESQLDEPAKAAQVEEGTEYSLNPGKPTWHNAPSLTQMEKVDHVALICQACLGVDTNHRLYKTAIRGMTDEGNFIVTTDVYITNTQTLAGRTKTELFEFSLSEDKTLCIAKDLQTQVQYERLIEDVDPECKSTYSCFTVWDVDKITVVVITVNIDGQ
eukprot:GHVS01095177.1.p1 GENE.GHVS01095177.1~~GHVS01095177.1.p1  ORF type:complete len:232 (-),score=25.52 GHVS01095177.1:235-930(-)